MIRHLVVVLVGAASLAAAGCTAGAGPAPSAAPSAAGPAAAPSAAAPSAAGPTAPSSAAATGGSTDTASWSTGTVAVRHDIAVPPVPRVVGIRSATHAAGYDRVTVDLSGGIPGYEVGYVDSPIAETSGEPVSMPGRRYLQIRLAPADAHDDSGKPTVGRARTLGLPMVEAYAVTSDVEGIVTIVLGLEDVVGFRVGELPGRIYVDVAAYGVPTVTAAGRRRVVAASTRIAAERGTSRGRPPPRSEPTSCRRPRT